MKKEIRFSAKIDDTEFNRSVEAMQRKLKDIYKGSDQGRTSFQNQERIAKAGLGPAPTQADRNRQDQTDAKARRDTDQFIKQQVRDQERLNKEINNRLKTLKALEELQKKATGDANRELDIKKSIAKVEDDIQKKRDMSRAKDAGIGQALDQRDAFAARGPAGRPQGMDRISQAYSKGGIGGAARAGMRMAGPGAIAGGVGALALTGADLFGQYLQTDANIIGNRASNQSVENLRMDKLFSGKGFEERMWSPERKGAKSAAGKFTAGQELRDVIASVGGMIVGGLVGSLAGPGGTVAGGVAGMELGQRFMGSGGGSSGIANTLGIMGVGKFGEERSTRYEAMRNQKEEQLFMQNKELSPMKKRLMEDFGENMMPNLQMQRSLGLSDRGLSGFNKNVTDAGFTRGMGRDVSGQMLAAGGSTMGSRGEGSALALRMQRDFDMTNAPQLLGKLSGTGGSAANAEKSLMGIMTASVKAGLDGSEYRKENQKFTENIADIVYKTGSGDPFAAAMIADRQAKFLADKTPRGVEAARTAAGVASGLQSETQGIGAVVEMGAMLKSPGMSSLGGVDLSALSGMTMDQIMAMPKEQQAYFEAKTGKPFSQLVKQLASSKEQKITMQAPELFGVMNKARKLDSQTPKTRAEADVLEKEKMLTEGEGITSIGARFGLQGADAVSFYKGLKESPGVDPEELKKKVLAESEKAKGVKSGRAADTIIEQQSSMEGILNTLQEKFTPRVGEAADELLRLRDAIPGLISAINNAKNPEEVARASRRLNKSVQDAKLSDKELTTEDIQETTGIPSNAPWFVQ
jgi:hypothetical protein